MKLLTQLNEGKRRARRVVKGGGWTDLWLALGAAGAVGGLIFLVTRKPTLNVAPTPLPPTQGTTVAQTYTQLAPGASIPAGRTFAIIVAHPTSTDVQQAQSFSAIGGAVAFPGQPAPANWPFVDDTTTIRVLATNTTGAPLPQIAPQANATIWVQNAP